MMGRQTDVLWCALLVWMSGLAYAEPTDLGALKEKGLAVTDADLVDRRRR